MLLRHELPYQLHGGRIAALLLYEEIENLAFIINRALKPERLASYDHGHLIEMPAPSVAAVFEHAPTRTTVRTSIPTPNRVIGNIQPPLRQQIFDVPVAEREPGVEPHGVPDDRRRELMACE
jgi:hypothetical protein